MNLGPRCNEILSNRCQCPNTVVEGTLFCKLHTPIQQHPEVVAAEAKSAK